MKVLETFGRQGNAQKGIFQYKRTSNGVTLDSSVSVANLNPVSITLTNAEWSAILTAIERAPQNSFRLTGAAPFPVPPNQSLHELMQQTVPQPAGGWNWHDSWKAYICAVLEHEGCVELYHGPLGPGHTAFICLRADIP
jgi:hypothetical protein